MHHRFLSLHCLAPLHCGTGQGIAGIDLPIQRERHTGWPVIPGSTIKGVLRDKARQQLGDDPKKANADKDVIALFGPEAGSEELGLGALSFGDGQLMAFPVRSLVGTFAWLTCPLALKRIARLPGAASDLADINKIRVDDEVILCSKTLVASAGQVVLEDQALKQSDLPDGLLGAVQPLFPGEAQELCGSHLSLVSDSVFSWFARHGTQVETRIALDPATKTVNDGAMFSQETVPPESVFISLIASENARHKAAQTSAFNEAEKALARLGTLCEHPLQFGGDATIGKGLCALQLGGV